MKKLLLSVAILASGAPLYAQRASGDTAAGAKRVVHRVGVQINELFRQIFNFSGNATAANTNPYLLTYSLNNVRSGWGLRAGLGYNYQSLTTDDGINRKVTDLNDLQARLGIEKAFHLSSRWTAGVGLDAVANLADNFTESELRSFDTVTTLTTTTFNTYGGGAMVWLRYNITNRILIGTETSYYYAGGTEHNQIAITRRDLNGGSRQLETTVATADNQRREGRIAVPTAFYLIVTF